MIKGIILSGFAANGIYSLVNIPYSPFLSIEIYGISSGLVSNIKLKNTWK